MKPPHEPDDSTARRGMEGLIAAMRGRRAAVTVDAPPAGASTLREPGGEDELALAAWRAMHVPLSTGSGEDAGCDGAAPAYLERGAVVGRYVILRQLGAGGMGVVYAAYDPELDRKVALKLVLPGRGDAEGRTRLLREAQALAKLSHRNVVTIHDVGTMGGQVWLAMEFVRGQTLREWLRTPRSWRAVLEVLRKAGRGLAAAHAAGLLHRDFKPDNVMVGARGRVRVMDFGLARARPHAVPSADESTIETVRTEPTLAMQVTQAGALLGTPVYMAPEQLLGREPTAAVDQYALCVTLWEALYGERPFAGGTHDELVEAVLAGKPRAPARGRGVPGWLRRVCERGLSTRPEQRFASIDALLEALAKGHARARVRKGLAAVGILALLGLGGEGWRRFEHAQRVAACEASGDEVAAAWNAERAQALHDALLATGVSYAPTTARNVTPWLDRQAAAWSEARVETCLDAEVRGRWGEEMHARSLWCLDERRVELETLVDELVAADVGVVQKAVTAATGLASVEPCRDERVLEALGLPSPEQREAIREVRAEVARAGSMERTGRYDKGLVVAREALIRAETLAWSPLTALARLKVGSLLKETGAYAEAERAMEQAYFEAGESSVAEVAADAAAKLAYLVGVKLTRYDDGLRWVRHAEVALVDVRDGARLRRGSLLGVLAVIHMLTGAYEESERLYQEDLAITEEVLGPVHPDVAMTLTNLANLHVEVGDHDEAIAAHERALAIVRESLGANHPRVAAVLGNLANAHKDAGHLDEAMTLYERSLAIYEDALSADHPDIAYSLVGLANVHMAKHTLDGAKGLYERAQAIFEKSLGPEHPEVGLCLVNLANVHMANEAHDEARVLGKRAVAIFEKSLGPEHPKVAISLLTLANVHYATDAHDEARGLYARALVIFEKVLGPEHPNVALTLNNLGSVYQDIGAHDDAKASYERALIILEESLGAEHPHVASPLLGLALVALAQNRPGDAVEPARQAVAVRERHGIVGEALADVRFVLARASWEAPVGDGRDRTSAVDLATQARNAYRDAGPPAAKELAEVEAWLAAHRLPPASGN